MDAAEFTAALRRDGYQVVHGGQKPNHAAESHTHDWDARVMVLGGEITITRDGKAERFVAGGHCEVPANTLHAEQVGPEGVAYIAGRRAVS